MDSVKTYLYENNLTFKTEGIKTKYLCGICNGLLYKPKIGRCGCRYCYDCILTNGSNDLCPLCKTNINYDEDLLEDLSMAIKIDQLLITCPHLFCDDKIKTKEMEQHLKSCNKRGLRCIFHLYGCEYIVNSDKGMLTHITSELTEHLNLLIHSISENDNRKDEVIREIKEEIQLINQETVGVVQNIQLENIEITEKIQNMNNEIRNQNGYFNNKIQQANSETGQIKQEMNNKIQTESNKSNKKINELEKTLKDFMKSVDSKFKELDNKSLSTADAKVKSKCHKDPFWAPNFYICKAITDYEFNRTKTDELSFTEGELIYVVKKNKDGWWEGVMRTGIGLFPGNYVTEN